MECQLGLAVTAFTLFVGSAHPTVPEKQHTKPARRTNSSSSEYTASQTRSAQCRGFSCLPSASLLRQTLRVMDMTGE